MVTRIETLLTDEIEKLYDRLSTLSPDSKEYAAVEANLNKFMEQKLEIERLRASEIQNEKQMKEERIFRIIKHLIDIGLGILPIMVTVWGVNASFEFEKEDTITSTVGRKFMDRLFSRK